MITTPTPTDPDPTESRRAGFLWDLPFRRNRRLCPETTRIVDAIPNLVSASVSRLQPESMIFPHRGDTNAIYRCHLPLVVRAPLPTCGIKVGKTTKGWEEGRLLVFCDAGRHRAWNHSADDRLVFIVDIIRSEFVDRRREICARVLADLCMQYLVQRSSLIRRSPAGAQRSARRALSVVIGVLLRFNGRADQSIGSRRDQEC
jgi:ornithine lipid ester-linked acyl 2-hydroxylase